jgi:poly(A) polymerase/tRNA nucleotidyltransferase (CCA-adding enzyme)
VAGDSRAELLADPGLARVWDALPEARVVGGAVRDALLGRPVSDVDLATPRHPEEVIRALEASGLRALPTGLQHGTVTAMSGARGFEVTTLRRDVATDGRHALVAFTNDWAEDAARRDLTFNAMSMDRAGTIFDYFNGRADLAEGRARFVGDPAARIDEDYLRVLRYFRFLARYARVPPDSETLDALRGGAAGLARLSPERVWSELKRIFKAPDPTGALQLMRDLGVLAAVLPEADTLDRIEALVAAGAPADPLLRLSAVTRSANPETLAERLRLSNAEADRLRLLWAPEPRLEDGASDADIRRALSLREMDNDVVLARAWLDGRGARLRARIATMPRPVFPVAGRDLLPRGIPPGPRLGETLRALEQAWRDGGCSATREELLALLPNPAAT